MDLYPLYNSLRIAGISAVIVFFIGIAAAYYIAKAPRVIKGILDVLFTLPLVLPPTVVGYLLLLALSPKRDIGAYFFENFGIRLTMQWWSAIFAVTVVVFPLMYRTARGAFERFDEELADAGRTLGLSNTYIFWPGDHRRSGAEFREGFRRIRRDVYDSGLYPRQNSDRFHSRLSAVEDRQR